jgi:hypothetical protein
MFGAGEIIHPQVGVEPDKSSLGKLLEGLPAPFDLHLSIDRPDKDPRICRPSDHDLQSGHVWRNIGGPERLWPV